MEHYLDDINKGFMEPRPANHIPLTPLSFYHVSQAFTLKGMLLFTGKENITGRRSTNGRCVWQVQSKMLV